MFHEYEYVTKRGNSGHFIAGLLGVATFYFKGTAQVAYQSLVLPVPIKLFEY